MPWDAVRAAKAAHEAALFRRANVVGVALGRKVVRGEETDEECVVVFVERKRPEDELRKRDIVPKAVDGVRTDVVETGRFAALAFLASTSVSRTARVRPAPGGVSVGHERVSAGTLGGLVYRDGRPMILSNNHILANANNARAGDRILQPARADGGTADDAIARLADFVPLEFNDRTLGPLGQLLERGLGPFLALVGLGLRRLPRGALNAVDAAIGEPIEAGVVSPDILDIGRVSGAAAPEIGMAVRKSGRTSGTTRGRITALDAVVDVSYGPRAAVFRGQIVGDLLSRGGDSGSLVVDGSNRALGLLFAGSPTTTLINPIDAVLRLLRITLE